MSYLPGKITPFPTPNKYANNYIMYISVVHKFTSSISDTNLRDNIAYCIVYIINTWMGRRELVILNTLMKYFPFLLMYD